MAAQLALLDELAFYHAAQSAKNAYFGILSLNGGARPEQKLFPVEAMPDVLRALSSSLDTYIWQAQFRTNSRTIDSLSSIGLVWADLDDALLGQHGNAIVVKQILRAVDEQRITAPSLIVGSGCGYVKWLFEKGHAGALAMSAAHMPPNSHPIEMRRTSRPRTRHP